MVEEQLPLPLDWRAARGRADFLVSDANREAVGFLDGWTSWPLPVALLIGPAGSGKSHLAAIFARRANSRVWDDADRAQDEEALFHAWNEALNERRPLLMTARSAVPDWHLSLPDLQSRLAATPSVRIRAPDDMLVRGLIVKLLKDRSLDAAPELVGWLAARVERSFDGIALAIRRLDAASLGAARALTIPFAREILKDL